MYLFRCCARKHDDVDREGTLLSPKIDSEKQRSRRPTKFKQPHYGLVSQGQAAAIHDHSANQTEIQMVPERCDSGTYCLAMLLPDRTVENLPHLLDTAQVGTQKYVQLSASSSAQLLDEDSDEDVVDTDNPADKEEVCFSKLSEDSRWSTMCETSNGCSLSEANNGVVVPCEDSGRKIICDSPDTGISWSFPDITSSDDQSICLVGGGLESPQIPSSRTVSRGKTAVSNDADRPSAAQSDHTRLIHQIITDLVVVPSTGNIQQSKKTKENDQEEQLCHIAVVDDNALTCYKSSANDSVKVMPFVIEAIDRIHENIVDSDPNNLGKRNTDLNKNSKMDFQSDENKNASCDAGKDSKHFQDTHSFGEHSEYSRKPLNVPCIGEFDVRKDNDEDREEPAAQLKDLNEEFVSETSECEEFTDEEDQSMNSKEIYFRNKIEFNLEKDSINENDLKYVSRHYEMNEFVNVRDDHFRMEVDQCEDIENFDEDSPGLNRDVAVDRNLSDNNQLHLEEMLERTADLFVSKICEKSLEELMRSNIEHSYPAGDAHSPRKVTAPFSKFFQHLELLSDEEKEDKFEMNCMRKELAVSSPVLELELITGTVTEKAIFYCQNEPSAKGSTSAADELLVKEESPLMMNTAPSISESTTERGKLEEIEIPDYIEESFCKETSTATSAKHGGMDDGPDGSDIINRDTDDIDMMVFSSSTNECSGETPTEDTSGGYKSILEDTKVNLHDDLSRNEGKHDTTKHNEHRLVAADDIATEFTGENWQTLESTNSVHLRIKSGESQVHNDNNISFDSFNIHLENPDEIKLIASNISSMHASLKEYSSREGSERKLLCEGHVLERSDIFSSSQRNGSTEQASENVNYDNLSVFPNQLEGVWLPSDKCQIEATSIETPGDAMGDILSTDSETIKLGEVLDILALNLDETNSSASDQYNTTDEGYSSYSCTESRIVRSGSQERVHGFPSSMGTCSSSNFQQQQLQCEIVHGKNVVTTENEGFNNLSRELSGGLDAVNTSVLHTAVEPPSISTPNKESVNPHTTRESAEYSFASLDSAMVEIVDLLVTGSCSENGTALDGNQRIDGHFFRSECAFDTETINDPANNDRMVKVFDTRKSDTDHTFAVSEDLPPNELMILCCPSDQAHREPELIVDLPNTDCDLPEQRHSISEQVCELPEIVYHVPKQIRNASEQIHGQLEQVHHVPEEVDEVEKYEDFLPEQTQDLTEQELDFHQKGSHNILEQIENTLSQFGDEPKQGLFEEQEQVTNEQKQIVDSSEHSDDLSNPIENSPILVSNISKHIYSERKLANEKSESTSEQIHERLEQVCSTSEQIHEEPNHAENLPKQVDDAAEQIFHLPNQNRHIPEHILVPLEQTCDIPQQMYAVSQKVGDLLEEIVNVSEQDDDIPESVSGFSYDQHQSVKVYEPVSTIGSVTLNADFFSMYIIDLSNKESEEERERNQTTVKKKVRETGKKRFIVSSCNYDLPSSRPSSVPEDEFVNSASSMINTDHLLSPDTCPNVTGSHGDVDDDGTSRPPSVRRSVSLKTSPTGTPRKKKAVRFADALGLELESIRHIRCSDEIPIVPDSAIPADSTGLTQSVSTSGGYLGISFMQPGSLPDFLCRVFDQRVCLESCVPNDRDFLIKGFVRVFNLSYRKSVIIRYTTNSWSTFRDNSATYVTNSSDGTTDRFSFRVVLPKCFKMESKLEFAIWYRVGEDLSESYWDNNRNSNYVVQWYSNCVEAANSDTPAWLHFL